MYASILNHKDLNCPNRIDAEFYGPFNLSLLRTLKKHTPLFTLENASSLITDMGAFSLYRKEYFVEKGIPFLRVENIKNNFLDLSNLQYISDEYHNKLSKSKIKPRDVLLTTKAIIGQSCTVPDNLGECNMSQNLVRIRIQEELFNPYYVSTFLASKYGRFQTNRLATGNVQLYLNFENIKQVIIPKFTDDFQGNIEMILKDSEQVKFISGSLYKDAERFLLSELCLSNWQTKHRLSFVRSFSETEQAERIDAEYFQPKYDEIAKAIKKYKGGWDTLGNLVSVKKCVEVGRGEYLDEGIPFVRVSNLSPFEVTEEKYISEKLYSELMQHQPKQGEILFSKDATPGIAYHLKDNSKRFIPSGGILRLKLKNKQVNEDYLTLALNSLIVKEQINRDVGGSVILHWRPDQVKDTLIPLLPEDKQSKIQQKISESFNLRKQSKHLLECAKKAVELAIEKDEKTAMQWLKKQTQNN